MPRVTWPEQGVVYIELDVETSGGKKAKNRVISLAAQTVDAAGKPFGEPFNELISIASAISAEATRVHGLTTESLKKAKGDFKVCGKLWLEWLAPAVANTQTVVLAAHNGLACDFRLLAAELQRAVGWRYLPGGRTCASIPST